MKKKTIAIIMAILAVVLCFTLAACGDKPNVDDEILDKGDANIGEVVDSTDDTNADEAAPAVVEDLARIKAAGKMIVGMTIYEPMNYWTDETKTELTGFDVDIINKAAELGGFKIYISNERKPLSAFSGLRKRIMVSVIHRCLEKPGWK